MSCRLCGQNRPLRRSHIVPEFLYKSFYDPKHRFFGMSVDAARQIELFQKGLRERLLCAKCEVQLSVYEHYARDFFVQTATITIGTTVQNLDYRPLKLFFLSLIWRFGITSLEYFRGITLGPHEKKMRAMLRAGGPGTLDDYPFSLTAVLIEGNRFSDLIIPPSSPDLGHDKVWNIVVAGHVITYFIAAPGFEPMWQHVTLKPDGTMYFQVREISAIPYLFDHARRVVQAQRARGGKLPT